MRIRAASALALITLFAGGCFLHPQAAAPDAPTEAQLRQRSLNDIVLPALVGIRTGRVWGSGVVVHPSGIVLTASHVLPASWAGVLMDDGLWYRAQVLVDNPTGDFAVLKIEHPGPFAFVPLAEGAERLEAVTLYGMGTDRIPRWESGKVLVRQIHMPATGSNASLRGQFYYRDALLHSARGREGDSGGPLVNAKGHLIGVNVASGEDLWTLAQSAARFAPVLELLSGYEEQRQLMADLKAARPPGTSRSAALDNTGRLFANQIPPTVTEEIELTLRGLVDYALTVAPERRADIEAVAAKVRAQALALRTRWPGRSLFKWVWHEFLHRVGLADPVLRDRERR